MLIGYISLAVPDAVAMAIRDAFRWRISWDRELFEFQVTIADGCLHVDCGDWGFPATEGLSLDAQTGYIIGAIEGYYAADLAAYTD